MKPKPMKINSCKRNMKCEMSRDNRITRDELLSRTSERSSHESSKIANFFNFIVRALKLE